MPTVTPTPRRWSPGRALIVALRPRQWTKNVFVFAALVLTGQLGDPQKTHATVIVFLLFCGASSAVYLLNDLADVKEDRLHPVKRLRPIASGDLDPRTALAVAAALAVLCTWGGFAVRPMAGAVILSYLALQLAYTYFLKHLVIVEALAIAAGFAMRVLAGGAAIHRPISPYLYLTMMFLALFQAFSKRRHEIRLLEGAAGDHRRTLAEYTIHFLDDLILIVCTATVVTYSLYAITTPDRPPGVSANMLLLTVPFVLYAVFRYLFLIKVEGQGGTPEEMLLSDRPLLLSVLGWAGCLLVILYVLPRVIYLLPSLAF
jgi:4-hydroxybenzoate polyprenyltransferase